METEPARYVGYLDCVVDGQIHGWARNRLNTSERVRVELVLNDIVRIEVTAESFRPDLLESGHGDGCHSFRVPIPTLPNGDSLRAIRAELVPSRQPLAGSPILTGKTKEKLFCPVPWDSLSIQPFGVTLCCQSSDDLREHPGQKPSEAFTGAGYRRVRESFLRGEWPKECGQCAGLEAQGASSKRQQTLAGMGSPTVTSSEGLSTEPLPIAALELSVNRICNLKCRMCGPAHSSRWDEDISFLKERGIHWHAHDKVSAETIDVDDGLLERLAPNPELVVKGGEPMLVREYKDLFRRMIDRGIASRTRLTFFTNGTTVAPWFLELAPEFKSVLLVASVDASGPLSRYIRHGRFTSDDVLKNLDRIRAALPKSHFRLATAFQTYNMLSYDRLVREFKPVVESFAVSYVTRAAINARSAPRPLREKAIERIEALAAEGWESRYTQMTFSNLLRFLREGRFNPAEWRTFHKFTAAMDETREESIDAAEPELTPYMIGAAATYPSEWA